MIEIKHLSKTFSMKGGTVAALQDIDLTIEDGDIYGIIGMSGAGKSTLVRCINMLERPTAGTVVVNGMDMGALSPAELRDAPGRILQKKRKNRGNGARVCYNGTVRKAALPPCEGGTPCRL